MTGCVSVSAVPPSPAVVTDESGSVVDGAAGPYLEGGRVVLTCKTIGGKLFVIRQVMSPKTLIVS